MDTPRPSHDSAAPGRPGLAARLLAGLCVMLPAGAVRPVAQALAWLYRVAAPRKLQRAQSNLRLALGNALEESELERIARASIVQQGLSLIETVREIRRPGAVEIEGVEAFTAAIRSMEQASAGQILVSAHLGSWELMNRAVHQASEKGYTPLAKALKQGAANDLLDSLRRDAGVKVLPSGAKSTLKRMLEVLKTGGWLGLGMDQKPDGAGIPVEFFGRQTAFVVGPASLIQRQRCRVLAAYCLRHGPARYRLLAREVEIDPASSREAITQRLAEELERTIRDYPEQWLWTYRRWPGDRHPPRDGVAE